MSQELFPTSPTDIAASRETYDSTAIRFAQPQGETGVQPELNPFALDGRTVLLAMDGSAGAVAGARVARALAASCGAIVHVLRVIDSRAVPFPPALDVSLAVEDPDRDLTSHQKEVQELRSILDAITGQAIDWPIRITIGTPATVISEEAGRLDAALVIVGLHKYGRVDRSLNNETSLNVMRKCSCPVLGVVPGTTGLPDRILAATDFSIGSLAAAHVARAIAGENASLVLAYVPPIMPFLGDEGERRIHDLGVRVAFADATRELGQQGVSFDHIALEHDLSVTTAAAILAYAAETDCDLIAAGSARQGRLERWMTGSVSTEIVRDARRSVLIVPPTRA